MQIVILGGGTVGSTIATTLCNGYHNITVVEKNRQRADNLKELEIRVVQGSASQSNVLFSAGVASCDLCIAVTGSEETNILAASIAKEMGAKRTIARVYSSDYTLSNDFDYQQFFKIDRLISLGKITALELVRVACRTRSQVLDLVSRGELEVQEIEIQEKSPVIGQTLKQLHFPSNVRVSLLKRGTEAQLMSATDSFQKGDIVSLIGTATDIESVVKTFFKTKLFPRQRVAIMGGGQTGYYVAQALQNSRFEITLFESDPDRCNFLASHLNSFVSVVNANGLNRRDLEENAVNVVDSFIACTGNDENNIMAAVEAKELGAKHVFAVVSRSDYSTIVKKLGIDHVVNPRIVIANRIRSFLNTGMVIMRTHLTKYPHIEVIEIEALPGAPICQDTIQNVGLPKECLIAGVNHKQNVRVPGADFRIQPGDIVIVAMHNNSYEDVLKKFKV